MSYKERIEKIDFLENTWQTALNQTEIYSLITKHFCSPLPGGKKIKKAIVIGYDGCTCEMLNYIDKEKSSAIKRLISEGGHGVYSYSGGAAYPDAITQETSTAPGWCSMLTSCLAEETGVYNNGISKALEPKSLIIRLVDEKTVNSSAFYVSWEGHFSEDGATYLNEKRYAEENKLKIAYACAEDDDGTRKNVLDDVNSAECSDFIFSIFEYTDHNGHGYDYLPEKPEYMQAFNSAEQTGCDIIEAIKNRRSFNEEDWLILITSDHGGYKCGHGGDTLQERITFIISNREIL